MVDAIFDKLLEKAEAEGKTSITFLTGVGGAGKSTALNNKEIDLNNEGVIFDGAFNSYDSLAKKNGVCTTKRHEIRYCYSSTQ